MHLRMICSGLPLLAGSATFSCGLRPVMVMFQQRFQQMAIFHITEYESKVRDKMYAAGCPSSGGLIMDDCHLAVGRILLKAKHGRLRWLLRPTRSPFNRKTRTDGVTQFYIRDKRPLCTCKLETYC